MMRGKQRRYLRGLGHHLKPVVQVGQQGVTEGLVGAVEDALLRHELIKIRVGDAPETREQVAERLSAETGAEVVQTLGHTVLLYRPHPEKPRIRLPTVVDPELDADGSTADDGDPDPGSGPA